MDISGIGQQLPAARTAEAGADDVKRAVRVLNQQMIETGRYLDFSVDKETGLAVIKVIDRRTREVLTQFPSQDVVEIARALGKLQGLLVKDRA